MVIPWREANRLVIPRSEATWESRRGTVDSYRLSTKRYAPIASVAAVTAQPLAALPPYGCGVPLAGNERPAGWQYLRHKFIGAMPSSLSWRGGRRPTWQSRSARPHRGKAISEIVTACTRLPRPFQGLAMTNRGPSPFYRWPVPIGSGAPGAACRSPTTHDWNPTAFLRWHWTGRRSPRGRAFRRGHWQADRMRPARRSAPPLSAAGSRRPAR